MNLTDVFIRRPVFATVLSLILLLVGVRSYFSLPVRQYPKIDEAVVTVTVNYTGAPAELMEGFVTTPLENAIAGVEGIDYMTSSSTNSTTSIVVNFKLGYDINTAFPDVSDKVSSVRWQLPKDIDDPVVDKKDPNADPTYYLAFLTPPNMSIPELTDYLNRNVQPQIQTLTGVGQAQVWSAEYAMRIWLDPNLMAAHSVSADDVVNTLLTSNVQAPTGTIKGSMQQFNLGTATDVNTPKQFNDLIIKSQDGRLTRISDVGRTELGSRNYDVTAYVDGQKAVVMGITPKPNANPLDMSNAIDKFLPQMKENFPSGTSFKKIWDKSKFIRASIDEVKKTIIESAIFVIVVVFFFLGSMRVLLIPAVTIPLSLIGVCGIMLAMGYSINTLTLMAMVLAIGMVVDDAIVVAENIHRHIVEGKTPFEAALVGAREIQFAIISITLTLAAVYAPIGFLTGLTGALFKEFAFTLASTVIISGFIALTLSPMMCSKVMTKDTLEGRLAKLAHHFSDKTMRHYRNTLSRILHLKTAIVLLMVGIIAATYFIAMFVPRDLAPKEDVGGIFIPIQGPAQANLAYMEKYTSMVNNILTTVPEKDSVLIVNGNSGANSAFCFFVLKDWSLRKRGINDIIKELMPKLWAVPGVMAFPLNPDRLPGVSSSYPVNFIAKTTGSYEDLDKVMQAFKVKIKENPAIINADLDLKIDQPQIDVNIDRNKAGDLGISMQAISNAINLALGEQEEGRFAIEGRSYDVVPQLEENYRTEPDVVNMLQLHTKTGDLVPLSNLVTLKESIRPESLQHFQQLREDRLTASLYPGYSLGSALTYLRDTIKPLIPPGFNLQIDYGGESRQFMTTGLDMLITFIFALVFIFLILAAQFESFKSPFVVMFTVPLSTFGALIALKLCHGSLNIYSEIGIVTLVGLISKHGILMVEFANQLREQGKNAYDAIMDAATIRLRPILMTTAAMILGAFPLALAYGPGAVSRSQIGWVIIGGMSIGTLFTLFVVPTIYLIITGKSKHGEAAQVS